MSLKRVNRGADGVVDAKLTLSIFFENEETPGSA